MKYDYRACKVVVVVSSTIEAGIAMNIVGHLAAAFGASAPEGTMGRDFLVDASGVRHRGISKYPVIVTKAKHAKLRKAVEAARQVDGVQVHDFPREMLDTGHDDELASAINLACESGMEYLGALFFGKVDLLEPITGRFSLWK